jgi:hypothetical protein
MNNLKQYAGLLNDAAPKNHFLAYINSNEANMLKQSGGSGEMTPQGILSFRPQDMGNAANQASSAASTGSSSSGSSSPAGGASAGGNYGGNSSGGTSYNNMSNTGGGNTGGGDLEDDPTATQYSPDFTPTPAEKSVGDKIMDFVKGGGVTGSILRSIGGKLGIAKENKYDGITGEDGYGEGDYISTQGDWAESKGFVNKAEDYYTLDLEEQQDIDKQMYDAGVRSQAFNDLYEGDTSNVNNLTSTERDAVNSIIPDMAYEVGGTTAQPSMVNDYFANLNNTNLGISENYLNTYNTAKSKMANTLNITPNTQQYGYGNSYNDTYSRSMNNTNVFYNYLNEQGLI